MAAEKHDIHADRHCIPTDHTVKQNQGGSQVAALIRPNDRAVHAAQLLRRALPRPLQDRHRLLQLLQVLKVRHHPRLLVYSPQNVERRLTRLHASVSHCVLHPH